MKPLKMLAYSGIIVLASCSTQAQDQHKIHGQISTTNDPQWAILRYYDDHEKLITDSAKIVSGSFDFTHRLKEPTKGYVQVTFKETTGEKVKPIGIQFYIEPQNVTITEGTDGNELDIKGSKLNDEVDEIYKIVYPPNGDEGSVDEKFVDTKVEAFLKTHSNSVVSLDLIKMVYLTNPEKLEAAFNALSSTVKNSKSGQKIEASIKKQAAVKVGMQAPGFTEKDPQGKEVSLSDFKGKYVLVDFWASWCHPCRMENPHVLAAYNKYKDRNFTVLGISLDSKKEDWLKAVEKDQLPWTQVSALDPQNCKSADLYGVEYIPQNWLIDPQGKIIARNLSGKDFDKLDELLR
ncbi:thioredoxin [Chitinophaga caeni]|uniref:Thioredoxin n=1 Tax=Chitinophaga caeni TaxID=2029983 RepID=A0A291QYP0_9BACT|nr:TlpA disulfide reductase family protein [Chitinophaga caeni]ATL49096.1 thioredoxin [Chitinophaga caeni]